MSPSDNKVEGSSEGGVPSAPPLDNEVAQEGDSICNEVGPSGDDAMPIFRRNPDRAVRSARGGSVASLRTSDKPSSDDESTEDVFSFSAYEQVESEDEDDESNKDHNDEDDKDNEGRDEEMTIESKINNAAFNDADKDSNAPVAAELDPNDIMIGVHYSQLSSHPGNMRATELALLNYKEYCGAKSCLVKRAIAAKLSNVWILRDIDFYRRRVMDGMTMSDEQTHSKFRG